MRSFLVLSVLLFSLAVPTTAFARPHQHPPPVAVQQAPLAAAGQQPPAPPVAAERPATGMIRLFLDCYQCDSNYIRTELEYVDHVRNREDADVHVLVTTRGTGSGGTEWTMQFIGLGVFERIDDELVFATAQTDSSDTRRRIVTQMLALGLTRYTLHSQMARSLQLSYRPSAAGQAVPAIVRDPWNYWVFRTRVNGELEGESRTTTRRVNSSFSANRTTDAWKVSVSGSQDYRQNHYTFSDGDEYLSVRRSQSADGIVVKSLTAHWSAGLRSSISSSTYYNQRLAAHLTPVGEYNIYPYAESTRRQLTLRYSLGYRYFDYFEETLFGKMTESLLQHSFRASYDTRQPWGSASADFEFAQFLPKADKYSLVASAETDIRLFKGFSFNVEGRGSRINDQLYLERGDASNEEVLAEQRQLATSYRLSFQFGISYTFGSIFNNVVNTRIGG